MFSNVLVRFRNIKQKTLTGLLLILGIHLKQNILQVFIFNSFNEFCSQFMKLKMNGSFGAEMSTYLKVCSSQYLLSILSRGFCWHNHSTRFVFLAVNSCQILISKEPFIGRKHEMLYNLSADRYAWYKTLLPKGIRSFLKLLDIITIYFSVIWILLGTIIINYSCSLYVFICFTFH